jgi:hypothetical protein
MAGHGRRDRVGAVYPGGQEARRECVSCSGRVAGGRGRRHRHGQRGVTGNKDRRGQRAVLDDDRGLRELRPRDVKHPGLLRVGEEHRGPYRVDEVQVAADSVLADHAGRRRVNGHRDAGLARVPDQPQHGRRGRLGREPVRRHVQEGGAL